MSENESAVDAEARRKEINESLEQLREIFAQEMDCITAENEDFWNSLTSDEQLKVFCAISTRIYQAEIKDCRSYRGVLYDVFGFGPEAYVRAQHAGYLDIHNSIINRRQLLADFAEFSQVDSSLVDDFARKYRL